MNPFTQNPPSSFDPIFSRIGNDWMLICASDGTVTNAMTASWGCCGILWNRPVAICFVRPERFTYPLLESATHFSLAFFENKYRDALTFCGRNSGRDCDKLALAGLTPRMTAQGVPYPAEASEILICRKLYADSIQKNAFCDSTLTEHYKDLGFHRFFVGEIESYLRRTQESNNTCE